MNDKENSKQASCTDKDDLLFSFPEINTLCIRAARGAGFSWGMSEECGNAAVWLAVHGFSWSDAVLARLTGGCGADILPAPAAWRSSGPICGVHAGVILSDFATLDEGPHGDGIIIGQVLDPLCLLPFIARTAQILRSRLIVKCDNVFWVSADADGAICVDIGLDLAKCGTIEVRPASATSDLTPALPLRQGGASARLTYAHLVALALNMAVPATEESHARAGAKGSDND